MPQFPHLFNEVITNLPRVALRIRAVNTGESTQHSPDTDTQWGSLTIVRHHGHGGGLKAEC